ncbi:MAG: leucine-rich repeat domain-containing protein, partial [Lachnospiraceae bacterium]|nr:leucine-rich repeat domain-containing protein [Lachnospiraceae bacterium]
MNRHFKRNITFLLLCLVLSLFAGKRVCECAEYGAPLESADGLYEYKLYKPEGGTQTCASIVSYLGVGVYVTLPTYLDGYKVTAIEPTAFSYDKVVQVNIPEGYLQIDYAFEGCKQLKTVYLPSTIKTCEGAFHESTLEYISIGAGEYDLSGAFVDCKKLKKAVISGTVSMCTEAFKGCTALTEVTIKSASDYNNFYKTFQGCTSLTDVTIPEKVTFLNSTFYNCTSLKRVVLPKTLDSMENVFYNCTSLQE